MVATFSAGPQAWDISKEFCSRAQLPPWCLRRRQREGPSCEGSVGTSSDQPRRAPSTGPSLQ